MSPPRTGVEESERRVGTGGPARQWTLDPRDEGLAPTRQTGYGKENLPDSHNPYGFFPSPLSIGRPVPRDRPPPGRLDFWSRLSVHHSTKVLSSLEGTGIRHLRFLCVGVVPFDSGPLHLRGDVPSVSRPRTQVPPGSGPRPTVSGGHPDTVPDATGRSRPRTERD